MQEALVFGDMKMYTTDTKETFASLPLKHFILRMIGELDLWSFVKLISLLQIVTQLLSSPQDGHMVTAHTSLRLHPQKPRKTSEGTFQCIYISKESDT